MLPFRAIVFDLDGTLVNSVSSIAASLNALLAEEGLPPVDPADVTDMVGDGGKKLLERGFARAGRRLGSGEVDGMFQRYIPMLEDMPPAPGDLYPGVRETLARLEADGLALGVCSNKPYGPSLAALRTVGLLDMFGAVIGGDSLPQRKPDPEPLLACLAKLGAEPDEAVMVGDNANDVGTARAARVPVIAVTYGYPRMPVSALGADLVIDRFDELPGALERLGERVG
jgi:phosphoglycolate phosphatase